MKYDCIVVGGGPVGLYAGIYLGRFLRKTVIFHGGKPRAEWIPLTHNFPTYGQGLSGTELLSMLRAQAGMCGVEIREGWVDDIRGSDDEFIVRTSSTELRASKLILATGVHDIPPNIPDADHFKGRTIRHCPVCDAYEARAKKIAVIGHGDHAASMVLWLSHYTSDIILLTNGTPTAEISGELPAKLAKKRIQSIESRIVSIEEQGEQLGTIHLEDGTRVEGLFRGYSAMGLNANSELAAGIGAELDGFGYIITDRTCRTSIPGVYAAGDVVSGDLAQMAVGFGHAATAATSIHNELLDEEAFGSRLFDHPNSCQAQ